MKTLVNIQMPTWSGWIVVPLRLFLGVTFLYAGVQKLADRQYFTPDARGYIGKQIAAFATGSPLHNFLVTVAVPHAVVFGALVAYGEIALGLGVLLGLLFRPAAFCGLLLNLIFFLSADWHISPYFYGSDIVFLFCWLTLLIAGPANQVLPALDTYLVIWLEEHIRFMDQPRRAACYLWFLGVRVGLPMSLPVGTQNVSAPGQQYSKSWQLEQIRQRSRRNFIWGTLSGGAAMLALTWLAETLHLLPGSGAGASDNTVSQVTPTLGSPIVNDTPGSGLPDGVIARISDVPRNSAASFTLSSNGDPGILLHLTDDQFVAYDAVCTHAGCPVDYDPGSQQLICPCHGATFNPSKAAAVVVGPAQTPLTRVPITINKSAGTISLSQ